jgi:hypothetical protein
LRLLHRDTWRLSSPLHTEEIVEHLQRQWIRFSQTTTLGPMEISSGRAVVINECLRSFLSEAHRYQHLYSTHSDIANRKHHVCRHHPDTRGSSLDSKIRLARFLVSKHELAARLSCYNEGLYIKGKFDAEHTSLAMTTKRPFANRPLQPPSQRP